MRRFHLALLFCALAPVSAKASPAPGKSGFSEIGKATQVLLRRSYSSQVTWVVAPERVRQLVEEVSKLQLRPWTKKTVVKHGACMSQVNFIQQENTLLRLYVYQTEVFVVPPGRESNPQAFIKVQPNELPLLHSAIAGLNHGASCTR